MGGGTRVRAAWNAATWEIRLRADSAGPFSAYAPKKGRRAVLRLPLSPGLVVRLKRKEISPHRCDNGALYLTVPPAFRAATPPDAAVAPRPVPASEAGKRRAAIEAAREAVPAPSFSGPGRKK